MFVIELVTWFAGFPWTWIATGILLLLNAVVWLIDAANYLK